MPREDNEISVTLSVLDRLVDHEPDVKREPILTRSQSLRQMKESVKRDIEILLNTRQGDGAFSSDFKEVTRSLLSYGLPDFTSVDLSNPRDQNRLRRALESAIRTFEPRLEGVSITLEPMHNHERTIRFQIDARLQVEPAPELVTFDTVLQLHSGEYRVKEEG